MGITPKRLAVRGAERLGLFDPVRAFFRPGRHTRLGADDIARDATRRSSGVRGPALLELRPAATAGLPGGTAALSAEHAALMRAAHAEVASILDAARGRRLSLDELRRILPHVNPTGAGQNCLECTLALDEIQAGKAVVAGPTRSMDRGVASRMLHERALYPYPPRSASGMRGVERHLRSFGGGARGIIMRWGHIGEGVPTHAYNIVNANGQIVYLDGQVGKMFYQHPARGAASTYEFYHSRPG